MALPSLYTASSGPTEIAPLLKREHSHYAEMRRHWQLCDDLLDGTLAMRGRGSLYLTKGETEHPDNFRQRLSLAYLDPIYASALDNYSGRAFGKEPVVDTALPREWLEDIDLNGSSLIRLIKTSFRDALNHGLTHFLIDTPPATNGIISLYDERTYNIRPFVRHIPSADLFDWQASWVNGRLRVTHARLYEPAFEQVNRFEQRITQRIRVIEPGRWEIYDLDGHLLDSGETDDEFIPLVTANINPIGFMHARPLNEALAAMNLALYQSTADQRHILHHSRVPLGKFTGLQDTDRVPYGAGLAMSLPFGADFEYVETSGIPAEIGNADIEHLERRMSQLALEPLLPTNVSGDRTATEAALGDLTGRSRLEDATMAFRDALEEILHLMARRGGVDIGNGTIDIKSNFSAPASTMDIALLQADVREGRITPTTYLKECKRRGMIADDVDVDAEIEKAQNAAPALLTGNLPPIPDDEETATE